MNDLASALAILSAMITPAVLITACGSLILTTSQRLGRVIERTRRISEQFEKLPQTKDDILVQERQIILLHLLNRATQRSRLLQRALMYLYLTLSIFVATSVAIGIFAVFGQTQLQRYAWIPSLFGMVGTGILFYTSLLLIMESRIAVGAVDDEMDFVLRLSQRHVPAELRQPQTHKIRRRLFRKFR
ncbi:DUF2721 domain-containing protein [Gloeocapsa sp. BRSZ]